MAVNEKPILISYVQHNDFENISKWVCRIESQLKVKTELETKTYSGIGTGFFCIEAQSRCIYFVTARHNFYQDRSIDLFSLAKDNSPYSLWSNIKSAILDTINNSLDNTYIYISKLLINNITNSNDSTDTQIETKPEVEKLKLKDMIDTKQNDYIKFKLNSDFVVFIMKNKHIKSIDFTLTACPLVLDLNFPTKSGPALIVQYPGKDSNEFWESNNVLGFDMPTLKILDNNKSLLNHNGSTLPGSSGSPIIQFELASNTIKPYVVGVHHGDKLWVKFHLGEGLISTSEQFCAVDIIYGINHLDEENLIANHTGSQPIDDMLLSRPSGNKSPIIPYTAYKDVYRSLVKIIVENSVNDKTVQKIIGTGIIVNLNNKLNLIIPGFPENVKLDHVKVKFDETICKSEVWLNSIKSGDSTIELFKDESNNVSKDKQSYLIKIISLLEQNFKLYAIKIEQYVKIRTSKLNDIAAILIGIINEAIAFQIVMINNINEKEYSKKLSAVLWNLEIEQTDYDSVWPCNSRACLFQLNYSTMLLELAGFGIKHDQADKLNLFGFGINVKRDLDKSKRSTMAENLKNIFCVLKIAGNVIFKGICCKINYESTDKYGVLFKYNKKLDNYSKSEESKLVEYQLEFVNNPPIYLDQNTNIISDVDYNFSFIMIENIQNLLNLKFLELKSIPKKLCQNNLLYYNKTLTGQEEFKEVTEIDDLQVPSGDFVCSIEKLQVSFDNIMPFIFNENEELLGIFIQHRKSGSESEQIIQKFNCGSIETIIVKIKRGIDKLELNLLNQKIAQMEMSNSSNGNNKHTVHLSSKSN